MSEQAISDTPLMLTYFKETPLVVWVTQSEPKFWGCRYE